MAASDLERFRLRRFVEHLTEIGEVEVHDEPVALADLSAVIEATPKAVLFRKAGPEAVELVANVLGGKRRLAAAFGVAEDAVVEEFQRRVATPQPVAEVPSDEAPVHAVVFEGHDVDLTRLPFHPQHELDGGTYISSAIDYAIDPATGRTNVGCRRLSLRDRRSCGTNLTNPSDLQNIYRCCVARGERLHVTFAVGSHPLDLIASSLRIPNDEVTLVGTLRGAPVPLVKSLTNDILAPADAEMIIEGWLDERGYIEPEGPFGEYMGYYGPMHLDPVFHVTAVAMREDVLHQSILHGSAGVLRHTESAVMTALTTEAQARRVLAAAGVEVVKIHVPVAGGVAQHLRVAIRQKRPGEARQAIHALIAGLPALKHVFVADEDVDVADEDSFEWALGTRFRADRDIVVQTGMTGLKMDPTMEGGRTGAKAGFDLTRPFGTGHRVIDKPAAAPRFDGAGRYQTVAQALESGPMYFTELMRAVGSRDGREVALAIDALRREGRLIRNADGQFYAGDGEKGRTILDHPPHEEF